MLQKLRIKRLSGLHTRFPSRFLFMQRDRNNWNSLASYIPRYHTVLHLIDSSQVAFNAGGMKVDSANNSLRITGCKKLR